MKGVADKNGKHGLSAKALAFQANVLHAEGDWVEARKVAKQGLEAFPESVGGKMCYNLVAAIEAKSSVVSTERVWNKPWPGVQVRYRNGTEAHFRIVKADCNARRKTRNYRPENLTDAA